MKIDGIKHEFFWKGFVYGFGISSIITIILIIVKIYLDNKWLFGEVGC